MPAAAGAGCRPALRVCGALVLVVLAGCGDTASRSVAAGSGPDPVLPPPHPTLFPTVEIAAVTGWPPGVLPVAAPGLAVTAFATNLEHPRNVYVLPNGDVLAVETSAPERPEEGTGLRGLVTRVLMRRAGAAGPSANRIVLLRDTSRTGVADTRSVFLDHLNSPFGVALVGDYLYVANTDSVMRYAYHDGDTRILGAGEKVVDLPAGPRNHHWTKNLVAAPDGRHLYVSVGSNSDHAEHGLAAEAGRAAIWEIDPQTGQHRILAAGLRNPDGLAFEPVSGALWTAVNERDELGSDLVPDYMTAVKDGGFYGWPYSYYGQHVDGRVAQQRPDLVASAVAPDYALGPHTASLGLAFCPTHRLPPPFAEGAFVGQHGSWNRRPPSGYKVVFVPFLNGRPAGSVIDVLTGFLDAQGNAHGRPVGVACDGRGGLMVADDVGNRVWRIAAASSPRQ